MSSVAESGLRASFQIESKRLGGDHENNTIWRLNTWICIFLQTNSSPKYLLFAILPLSTLLFTRELGLSLEFFGRVQNDNRKSLMETIGWQAGTRIHNFGIFTALILMCIFGLEGQPWKITWPVAAGCTHWIGRSLACSSHYRGSETTVENAISCC